MNVAIQGQAGSFHDKARKALFSHSDVLECKTFGDVFDSVAKARAEYGIVAIENSLYGSINEVYSLLLEKKLWISGEIYLHIKFALMAKDKLSLSDVEEVVSHPIALAECSKYLSKNLPNAHLLNSDDTAKAAKEVSKSGNATQAAIADPLMANTYNLEILAKDIENDHKNYTRFIIIQKDKQQPAKANKHSVILQLPEKPGTLHQALGFFAERNINLTKLESHPVPGEVWEYIFYVDFESDLNQAKSIIQALEDNGAKVKILGSYTKANPLGEN